MAHTYTSSVIFTVHLMVAGIENLDTQKTFTMTVTEYPNTAFHLKSNRRYDERHDDEH